MAILSPLAVAGMTVEGDRVAVYCGDGGTWTDPDVGACMSMFVSPYWRDICYAGTPFQSVAFKYDLFGDDRGGARREYG